MDTTTTSDDRGVSERGAEAFSVASFQSLVAPLSESASFPARSHAQKDAPNSEERACWAWPNAWSSTDGEPPPMCGGRTVPPIEESLPPTARPLPTSRQLPRTIFSPPQQCSTPGSSVPTCPRRQFWSIRELQTMPRSRTVPDAAEEPQPSRRQPQIRRRHDEPPRQWSMQWHTDRAALQPGPDPLDFIHDHGQAPAPPRPSLASGRVGLRANHENLHSQMRLIPHYFG